MPLQKSGALLRQSNLQVHVLIPGKVTHSEVDHPIMRRRPHVHLPARTLPVPALTIQSLSSVLSLRQCRQSWGCSQVHVFPPTHTQGRSRALSSSCRSPSPSCWWPWGGCETSSPSSSSALQRHKQWETLRPVDDQPLFLFHLMWATLMPDSYAISRLS